MVSFEGGNADTGKNLAMHIAAFNPVAVDDESVDADLLAREKDIIEAKLVSLASLITSLKK